MKVLIHEHNPLCNFFNMWEELIIFSILNVKNYDGTKENREAKMFKYL